MTDSHASFFLSDNENQIISSGGLTSIQTERISVWRHEEKLPQTSEKMGKSNNYFFIGFLLVFMFLFISILKYIRNTKIIE